ncbi:MAG: undecaprenyldiphospho-muramoylpentapeptide beta-N-acetylglucosaminyltransferase [Clostridia bacterium]|nr:undecaprenyldiphospho-muramoylpentapeptide beta-N-acetylglucosaminyltransferase [Clostridia bacterium]
MRVLMTGGGTAGHINPALSIAAKIKEECPDAEILFVGATGRMETTLVPKAGYPLKTVTVEGFQRKLTPQNVMKNVKAAVHAVTAGVAAAKIIRDFGPDIAIGTGGYVCGPVLQQAAKMEIPVLVHESNAYPGVTTKLLARTAKAVMLPTESARRYLPAGANAVVTGNPLRQGFAAPDRAAARRELGVDERPLVLSFGGSLGARPLNEAMAAVLRRNQSEQRLQFIVGTGRGINYERTVKLLEEYGVVPDGVHVRVLEYIDDMPRCMAAADVVVSRCGAMTLSELPAMRKPSILIPSPYVAENHQYHNAKALADRGAAVCIEEKELTDERLWDTLNTIALSSDRLAAMSEAAAEAAVSDATDRIWQVIQETLATA